ncbi:MAG: glycosyltransferase family 2 protein, partial [Planctomycetes bacterium]|nr:glycosyltransferase family 2 protein [Planctomycetota bacterium]
GDLNRLLGLELTDAFCGFKAYRVPALKKLRLAESGYAMPIELWVQVAHAELSVIELPVPRIYLEEDRSFGGSLDDATARLEYYYLVLNRSMALAKNADPKDPAICGDVAG